MIAALHVIAQAKTTTNPLVSLLPILLIGVVFYFLLIRPQRMKQRQQQELTRNVEEGDEVITIGGLYGIVKEVDEDSVLLEVAPGTELRFLRSAIGRKLLPEEEEELDADLGEDAHDEPTPPHDAEKDSGGEEAGAAR
jgi:preprotein translocase subunit YajC